MNFKFIVFLAIVMSLFSSPVLAKDACETTPQGNVACADTATVCESTPQGKVACGGQARTCRTTPQGAVACGGKEVNRCRNNFGISACVGW